MKDKLFLLAILAVLSLGACTSNSAPKTEAPVAAADTTAAAADAINIKVPSEFVVEMNEKGEMRIEGKLVEFDNLEKTVTEYFEGYRAMGAKTMPPLNIEIEGTVTMGIRGEVETVYNEAKAKFEGLH